MTASTDAPEMDFLGLWRRVIGKEKANRREGEAVAERGGGVFEGIGGTAGDSGRGNGWRGDFGLNMLKKPPLTGWDWPRGDCGVGSEGVNCCCWLPPPTRLFEPTTELSLLEDEFELLLSIGWEYATAWPAGINTVDLVTTVVTVVTSESLINVLGEYNGVPISRCALTDGDWSPVLLLASP
jgi:hypothetical protein